MPTSSHATLIQAVAVYQDALARAVEMSRCKVCGFADTEGVRQAEHNLRIAAMNYDREKVPA